MAALLRAIDAIRDDDGRPAIPRLRFVTSHPWDLSTRLIDAMAECDSVCEHLHLPVQAGDDAVLHRMGRQYTVDAYLDLVGRLRAAVPRHRAHHGHHRGLLRRDRCPVPADAGAAPDRALRRGLRGGVLAPTRDTRQSPADDVPAAVKRERLNALLDLQEGIGHERNRGLGRARRWRSSWTRSGRPAPTTTTPVTARLAARVAGRTRHNKLVHLDGGPDLVGRFVSVVIDHAGPYALTGRRDRRRRLTSRPTACRRSSSSPGETATGKTGLSLAIAQALDAEIVSADSRQVYRGMDIGTAKVGAADRARVPHHGLDLVDPDERFTAADFRRYALGVLAGIAERGRPAVLVGGTGLYLRAVARGLPMDTTGDDPVVRAELEAQARDRWPASAAGGVAGDRPERIRAGRPGEPPTRDPGHRAGALDGDVPPPAPEGYPAPVVWLGVAPATGPSPGHRGARPRPVPGRTAGRGGRPPRPVRRGPRALRGDGLSGSLRRPGRSANPGVGHPP